MNKLAFVVWLILSSGTTCAQVPNTFDSGPPTLVPGAVNTQELAHNKGVQREYNQVYVKVIMPTGSVDQDKDRPVVESWIAEDLKKLGQSKFTAVTEWVPLDLSPLESTEVWSAGLDKRTYCSVDADIERAKGPIIKVNLSGWVPFPNSVTVPLKDEPGSRVIAAVKDLKLEQGTTPYVAVFIGPPSQKAAASTD